MGVGGSQVKHKISAKLLPYKVREFLKQCEPRLKTKEYGRREGGGVIHDYLRTT